MKSDKLFTNVLIIGILLAISLGCRGLNNTLGGGSESNDPKNTVTSAYKKFMEAKFYHSVVKTKNAQTEVVTELDFNAPDRFWIKNNIRNMKSEIIAIGNESFMRMNDGKWSKMPAGKSLPIANMRNQMTEETFSLMKDFEPLGKENLNGKDTLVYKFKSTYGGESSSKIWISADSGLPLKVDTEGNYAGTNLIMSITYDYDKETKIEAPKVN